MNEISKNEEADIKILLFKIKKNAIKQDENIKAFDKDLNELEVKVNEKIKARNK